MGEQKQQKSNTLKAKRPVTQREKEAKTARDLKLRSEKSRQPARDLKLRSTKSHQTAKVTMNEGTFAKGLCFKKLFFIFIIGSVIGAIYEDVLIYLMTYFETGTGVWMLHRGVIYGPFNVIYGFGAAVMCWVLLRRKYTNWEIFGISAVLGGVVEYMLSYLQELVTGTTSWDYSYQFLNIQGRTTIPLMVVWGFLGLILVKVIYPVCSNLIERIPSRIGNPVFWVFLLFMIFDCLISWSAIIRQTFRQNNIPPMTPLGEFYDHYYTDEYLHHYFPNMVRTGGKK